MTVWGVWVFGFRLEGGVLLTLVSQQKPEPEASKPYAVKCKAAVLVKVAGVVAGSGGVNSRDRRRRRPRLAFVVVVARSPKNQPLNLRTRNLNTLNLKPQILQKERLSL